MFLFNNQVFIKNTKNFGGGNKMQSTRKLRFTFLLVAIPCLIAMMLIVSDNAEAASNTVAWGSKGQIVKDVQTRLKNWGYLEGSVDGVFGAKTYDAVIKFQKKNGIKADGTVGSKTFAALGLNKYVTASSSGGSSSSSTSADVTLLAKAIFAEAESEPYIGQVAVGAVLLNRVASADFPNTLSGVCYQGLALESVSNGRFNSSSGTACINAAKDAINGWDPTYGCLYFWNPVTSTSTWIWSRKVVVQYGDHMFGI
mgnify:CR=1 FL=1|jgi:N-acetylmuramoyl-L-alanine amidase